MAGEDDNDDIGGDVIVSLPGAEGEAKVTPAGDARVIENASFNEDPVADLKNQFANMQTELSTVRGEAQQTAQQLQEANNRLQSAEHEVVTSQLDTVLSGIAAANAEAEAAEKDYVAAAEAGDFAAQARAQRKMAGAEGRVQRLTEAKEDLEEATKRKPRTEAQPRQQPRQQPSNPVEALIANGGIPPKSAAWIRNHPEVATDARANARMMAAHNLAVADGIEVESDEYFRMIDEGMKKVPKQQQQQKVDPKPAAGEGNGTRPSSAAAAGGAAGGGLNGGAVDVRLTKGEARSATDGTLVWNYDSPDGKHKKGDPLGLAEMARRKHEGQRRGLYDKNNMEA